MQNPPPRRPSSATPSPGPQVPRQTPSPAPMTSEKAFYFYCAIYGTPGDAVDRYGSYFDATNYARAMADEFQRARYRAGIQAKIADEVKKLNFAEKFTLVGSTTYKGYTALGEYSFDSHSFPISYVPTMDFCIDAGRTFFGNCEGKVLHVNVFRVEDSVNGTDFVWSLPMSETEASAFIKSRAVGGGVNRRVAAKITYSIVNKKGLGGTSSGNAAPFIPFIYAVEIYEDESLARKLGVIQKVNSLTPSTPEEQRLAEQRTAQEQERRDLDTSRMLIGAWRDENSVRTYLADGLSLTRWDNGTTRKARWSVSNGVVSLVFFELNGKPASETAHRVEIVSITPESLTTKDSGGTWHSTRVK